MENPKTQIQSREQLVGKLRDLVAFLPSFKASDFEFGHWTEPLSDQPGVMILPYFSLSEVAWSFEQTAYHLGWVMRDFDWPTWKQTSEAETLRNDVQALEQATPEQLGRLLTVCIRRDESMLESQSHESCCLSSDAFGRCVLTSVE